MGQLAKKVLKMKHHEIITAMVDGLKNPKTKIDMSTYGEVFSGVCYGCAATNTILLLCEAEPVIHLIGRLQSRAEMVKENAIFLNYFESAINYLRMGDITGYLNEMSKISHNTKDLWNWMQNIDILELEGELPHLTDEYTEDDLNEYLVLAETLKELDI